ncbi:glutathione hydrolase 1 proenzyme-like [Cryptotermes secundus]|uniref:glutathione hydrolase 1 proenzyme-like n=1 Tax=Cryptotermes secundus TaxID=105785 RepID=UPI001454D1A8|nr:glutathione hydrolase 1 proenzyme-like [Cryptotermes secundus]
MGDERICLVNEESRQSYGSFPTSERGKSLYYHHITPECQSLLEKRQKWLVTAVVLCMFIVMVATILWGMPTLLARFLPTASAETNLPPFDSKEEIYTQAALSADSLVCSSVGRSVLQTEGFVVDAAIAVLLCHGLSGPHDSGLGGSLIMVVCQRSSRNDFAQDTLTPASRVVFQHDARRSGRFLVSVPGELIAMREEHKKFGLLPRSELVETSIRLCERRAVVADNVSMFRRKFQDLAFAAQTSRWSKVVTMTLQLGRQQLNTCSMPPLSRGIIALHILSILECCRMSSHSCGTVSKEVTMMYSLGTAPMRSRELDCYSGTNRSSGATTRCATGNQ